MKKILNARIRILAISVLSAVVISCSLDPDIDNTYGEEYAFILPEKAEGLLMNAYSNLPNMIVDDYGGNFLDAATDNAVTNDFNSGIFRMSQGGLTPNSNPVSVWTTAYNQFRNIHLFLDHGLGSHVNYDITSEENNIRKKLILREKLFIYGMVGLFQLGLFDKTTTDELCRYIWVYGRS